MRKWLKQGHLPKNCDEPENITEGPAMCITSPDKAKSDIVVGGLVGEDGKPVRIRVEDPRSIKKILKRREKKKKQRKRERERKKAALLQRSNGADSRSFSELDNDKFEIDPEGSLSSSDSDSFDDDLFELPKAFEKFIMKKTDRESRRTLNSNSENDKDDFSIFDSSGSNLSDLSELHIGSDDDLDELMADFLKSNSSSGSSQTSATRNTKKKKHKRRGKGTSKTPPSDQDLFSYSSSCFDTSSSCELSISAGKVEESTESFLKSKSELQAKRSKRKCKRAKNHKQDGSDSTDASSEGLSHLNSPPHLSPDHRGSIKSSLSVAAQRSFTSSIVAANSTNNMNKQKSDSMDESKSDEFCLPEIPGKLTTTVNSAADNSDKPSLHLPQLSQAKGNLVQQGEYATVSIEDSSGQDVEGQKTATTDGVFRSLTTPDDNSTSNKLKQNQLRTQSIADYKTVLTASSRLPSTASAVRRLPQRSSAILKAPSRAVDTSPTSTLSNTQKGSQKVSHATVQEGVSLPHNKQMDQSKHGRLKRKSIATDDLPLLRGGASQDRRMSETAGNYIDMQQVKAQSLDEKYAKRIGRKLIKKTKKNPLERVYSAKHNSKNIGGGLMDPDGQYIEDRSINNEEIDTQSALLFIPSAIDDPSGTDQLTPNQSLALQQSSQQPASALRRQSAGPLRDKAVPMPLIGKGGGGDKSRRPNEEETRPLSAGLGSRVPAKLTDKSSTPLKMPTPTYPQDYSQSKSEFTVGKQPQSLLTEATVFKATQEATSHNEGELHAMEAAEEGIKPLQSHGELEVITEAEDEDDSDDDYCDFKIAPIFDDKPITILSFTSSYAYSFYPMAAQYKKAYDVVHKRTLQPIQMGRNKAKVRARKR